MNVAVVMTTYFPEGELGKRRLEHAKQTLYSLKKLVPHPFIIIADDTGTYQAVDELTRNTTYTKVIGPHAGVGASINRGLNFLDSYYKEQDYAWIYLPDDLWLIKEMDLTQAVNLLKYYDYVRLDLPHPELFCKTKFEEGLGWWLELCHTNRDFTFATRPTLIKSSVHKEIGPWLEMADSYAVELDYSQRVSKALLKGALVCDMGNAWQHLSSDEDAVGYRPVN
jgi:hypothetical protein